MSRSLHQPSQAASTAGRRASAWPVCSSGAFEFDPEHCPRGGGDRRLSGETAGLGVSSGSLCKAIHSGGREHLRRHHQGAQAPRVAAGSLGGAEAPDVADDATGRVGTGGTARHCDAPSAVGVERLKRPFLGLRRTGRLKSGHEPTVTNACFRDAVYECHRSGMLPTHRVRTGIR